MSTPWAHLPNAAHIDRVLANATQHPETWTAARDAAWTAAWAAAWAAARGAARDAAWTAARDAAWTAARDAARDAARGVAWTAAWAAARAAARDAAWTAARDAARDAAWTAAAALIAWDDCAAYLTLPVDVVRHLSDDGIHAAVLLLPAVIVFAQQEKVHG